jgi:hypothetical protein
LNLSQEGENKKMTTFPVNFPVSREFSAETQTDPESVPGDVAPLAPEGLSRKAEHNDPDPNKARGSAVESANRPPAQAEESRREQPFKVAELFGKPALLNHEDLGAYKTWEQAVQAALQPRDLFEAIWARDFTHFTWEIERGRRLKKYLLEGAEQEAIKAMVRVRIDNGWVEQAALDYKAAELSHEVYNGDCQPSTFDLREEVITAQAYRQLHSVIDTLERQIAGWETRRNKLLRDLELRREQREVRTWYSQLAQVAQHIVDAHWAQAAEEQPSAQGVIETRSCESRPAPSRRANDGTRRSRHRVGPRSAGSGFSRSAERRSRSPGEGS